MAQMITTNIHYKAQNVEEGTQFNSHVFYIRSMAEMFTNVSCAFHKMSLPSQHLPAQSYQ